MNKLPLRPNVCLLIMNREGRLFLGERLGEPGVWQLPQGGVEAGSSEAENALREASEELGAAPALLQVVAKLRATHSYDWTKIPAYAADKWRGQQQSFYLLSFSGTDTDLKLDRFEPEFSSFRWCTAAEVRQLAEPKRSLGYLAALEEFENLIKR